MQGSVWTQIPTPDIRRITHGTDPSATDGPEKSVWTGRRLGPINSTTPRGVIRGSISVHRFETFGASAASLDHLLAPKGRFIIIVMIHVARRRRLIVRAACENPGKRCAEKHECDTSDCFHGIQVGGVEAWNSSGRVVSMVANRGNRMVPARLAADGTTYSISDGLEFFHKRIGLAVGNMERAANAARTFPHPLSSHPIRQAVSRKAAACRQKRFRHLLE